MCPFYPFLGEGSPTEIEYRKTGTLIPAALLEDLGGISKLRPNFFSVPGRPVPERSFRSFGLVSWEFPFNLLKVKQSLAGDLRTAQLRENLVLFDQLPFVDSLPFFNGGNHWSKCRIPSGDELGVNWFGRGFWRSCGRILVTFAVSRMSRCFGACHV